MQKEINVLLSIKPEFVEKIITGQKKYEYRKTIFKRPVKKVIIYSTNPVKKIIGEFTVEEVIQDNPEKLWRKTSKYSGIDENFFYKYFKNKKKAYAIKIKNVKQYDKPKDIKDLGVKQPPQSFVYI